MCYKRFLFKEEKNKGGKIEKKLHYQRICYTYTFSLEFYQILHSSSGVCRPWHDGVNQGRTPWASAKACMK